MHHPWTNPCFMLDCRQIKHRATKSIQVEDNHSRRRGKVCSSLTLTTRRIERRKGRKILSFFLQVLAHTCEPIPGPLSSPLFSLLHIKSVRQLTAMPLLTNSAILQPFTWVDFAPMDGVGAGQVTVFAFELGVVAAARG